MLRKYLKKLLNRRNERVNRYKKAYRLSNSEKYNKLTPHQALEMFVEADLTREQYEVIRRTNAFLYPCYDRLLEAKKECYPPEDHIKVTSVSVECTLQSLIDKTLKRLSIYLEDVLLTINEEERQTLTITCKWGCDGSQQAKYKQKFENISDSDANIFLSSFVPLQIFYGKNKVIWQNPSPSSPRFCRPIRLRFLKETVDVTKKEISYVKESANQLVPTEIEINDIKFSFNHLFKMTMVDIKICNAATDTKSTSRCFIC